MTGKGSDNRVMAVDYQDPEEPSPLPALRRTFRGCSLSFQLLLVFMLPCLCLAMQEVLSVHMPLTPDFPGPPCSTVSQRLLLGGSVGAGAQTVL